jgi:inorganic pyrophosphatase
MVPPEKEDRAMPSTPHSESFDVLIEIPKGSRNKYEMDKAQGRIRLDRTLFTAVHYPADYGYIEDTLALDGDPIDALVLVDEPTFPGCLIAARAVGVYYMSDEHGPDEKLLCVPAGDPRWDGVRDVADVPGHVLDEIAHFFAVYKALEPGKHVEGSHWDGREAAERQLAAAVARYGAEH